MIPAVEVLAATAVAVAVAAGIRAAMRPAPPLARLVRPYVLWGRSRLGLPPDPAITLVGGSRWPVGSAALASLFDGAGDDSLDLKLLQAGSMRELSSADRVLRYRMRRLLMAAGGGLVAGAIGLARGFEPMTVLVLVAVGVGGAVAYGRGRLGRRIEQRRVRIRIELYTTEQLLAMRLRVGGSVPASIRGVVRRSRGEVSGELGEALRLHDGGMDLSEALRRIAHTTPEPHAMRCYRTLAAGNEHGADVAAAMVALSEDVRDERREALRRAATRGRALMLVPIVGILAPVLLLFVGAPLPWLVLRGFG